MVSSLTDNDRATFHEHCKRPTWVKGKRHLQYSASLHQRCNDNLAVSAPLRRSDNEIWKNNPFYFVLNAFPCQKSRLSQGCSKHETSSNEIYQHWAGCEVSPFASQNYWICFSGPNCWRSANERTAHQGISVDLTFAEAELRNHEEKRVSKSSSTQLNSFAEPHYLPGINAKPAFCWQVEGKSNVLVQPKISQRSLKWKAVT